MGEDAVSQTQSNFIKLVVPNVKRFPRVKKFNLFVVDVIIYRMYNARICMLLNSDITNNDYKILFCKRIYGVCTTNDQIYNESKSKIMIIFT